MTLDEEDKKVLGWMKESLESPDFKDDIVLAMKEMVDNEAKRRNLI